MNIKRQIIVPVIITADGDLIPFWDPRVNLQQYLDRDTIELSDRYGGVFSHLGECLYDFETKELKKNKLTNKIMEKFEIGDVRQLDIETAIKTYYKSKGLVQAHVELRKLVNRIETESALALDSADWISLEGNEDKLQEFIEHDGDCLIKFDNDQICNYNDHDLPMAIITHFKKII